MEAFAALLDALVYTSSRNAKLKLIAEYLRRTPDPDRGWALAALTSGLDFPAVKPAAIRTLLMERVDPVLYALSRDYVGDTAETASLLWPEPDNWPPHPPSPPTVAETVDILADMTRASVMHELPILLDRLDANGRYALLKLATGAMRIGISARLAKTAFAQAFDVSVDDVEEYWHGQAAPYDPLFDWAARGAEAPSGEGIPLFRPFMLAHPLDETIVDMADAFAETWAAEWKWDGIRVQVVHAGDETRVYSRSGDDISGTFPEIAAALTIPAVLDGELLVRGSHQGGEAGGAASFNALQQRLGRKAVSKKMLQEYPAFVRLYDALIVEGEDLREHSWEQRRMLLEAFVHRLDPVQGAELLPVGKAYFGFTDEELKWLDRYVRRHAVNRFGPVRETDKSLVFEVAFDSVHESKRHKSGLAMRFPRISRIRNDKPVHEADTIEALRKLVRD